MSKTRVLLAIRLRQLGDVLATLGTLRALKRAAPERDIVFVVDGYYHKLLRNIDFIDRLLAEPPRFRGLGGAARFRRYVDQLRKLNVDCVLDFHSNTRSALLAWLSGARRRIGFDVRGRKVLYTDVEPRAVFRDGQKIARTSHESAMALARRSGVIGLEGSVEHTLPVTREEETAGRLAMIRAGLTEQAVTSGQVVGLNPGNPYPAKEWPESYFVQLARQLVERGRAVVLLWGPGERERAERIHRAVETGVFLAPRLVLEDIPGFLIHCKALVTIDSGLKHLAVAVGVPTVTLFGPTNPGEWHMGGERHRYLYAALSCSPCRLLECPFGSPPCMARIEPEDVLHALATVEGGVVVP